jgi:ADP-ribosylglycohydrolase
VPASSFQAKKLDFRKNKRQHRFMHNVIDRARGVLLGVGAGDSLGHEIEFLNHATILSTYGPAGVTSPSQVRKFRPSDDTQLTLLAAEALVSAQDFRNVSETGRILGEKIGHWRDHPRDGHFAPGGACMAGAARLQHGVHWQAAGGADAGGCGAVMRSSPYGIAFADPHEAAMVSAEHGRCTHQAPLSIFSTAYYAALVSRLVWRSPGPSAEGVPSGLELREELVADALDLALIAAVRIVPWTVAAFAEIEATAAMIREAAAFPEPSQAGNKWTSWAGHTAAAAATCILVHAADFADEREGFKQGIAWAVNHSGDSDSLGAIAGGLLGALFGKTAIPEEFLRYPWADDLEDLGSTLMGLGVLRQPAKISVLREAEAG